MSIFSFCFYLLRPLSKLLLIVFFFFLTTGYLSAHLPNYFQATQVTNSCSIHLKNKNFLKVKLENGIEALLISDPSLKYSSASLSIPYGGSSDPKDFKGVAHFVEHLLFLGNQVNPKENHFLIHTSNHGGYCNAVTDYDNTCFYFKISDNYFEESIKLFRNLFVFPLFTDSAIKREANAINEEFFLHKQSIAFLYDEVCTSTRNPNNSFNTFFCGNLKTLGQINRDVIQAWYNNHYSANQMRVILLSPRPLEDLEKIADEFAVIQNKHLHVDTCSEPIMKNENWGQIVYLDSKTDYQSVLLEWEIPIEFYHDVEYLSFLFTSSHPSSLQHKLVNNSLGILLEPRKESKGSSFILSLQINLTDKGIAQLNTVIGYTFEYLNLIKQRGVSKELFTDWRNSKMEQCLSSYSINKQIDIFDLSKALVHEDFETFPEKTYIGANYNEENLHRLFNSLTASKCQFIVIANESKTKVKYLNETPFFNANYATKRFDTKQLIKWDKIKVKSKLQLPNSIFDTEYLDDFEDDSGIECHIESPRKIYDEEGFTVFHAANTCLKNDRFFCSFHIKPAFLNQKNPKDFALLTLFAEYIKDKLLSHPLVKKDKQLDVILFRDLAGLKLQIEGNSIDQKDNIKDIFTIFKTPVVTQNSLKKHKANLINVMQEFSLNNQNNELNELLALIGIEYNPSLQAISSYIKKINQKELEIFSKNVFNAYCVDGFFLGDISDEKCIEIQNALKKELNGTQCHEKSCFKEKNLVLGNTQGPFTLSKTSTNPFNYNALIIQNERFCPKDLVLMDLLEFLINPIFNKELRTKKQTAYYLNTRHVSFSYTSAISFEIQSVGFAPNSLNELTEAFIEKFLNDLTKKVPKDLFEKAKRLHFSNYKIKCNSLEEMIEYYRSLISTYKEDMHLNDKKNECIRSVTYEDFTLFTKKLLSKSNKRRLSIQLKACFTDKKIDDQQTIQSIEAIRSCGEFVGYIPVIDDLAPSKS